MTRALTRNLLALAFALAATPAFALTVSLSAPAAGAVVAPGTAVTVSATATPTSGTTITKVEFFAGTTLIGTDTTSPYSISWANVQPGTYSLTAKATDSTGATATSAARSIRVNALPSVSLTAPANGANFLPGSTIALSATATDTDGSISQVQFFRGTTLIGTDKTSPYSFNWTNVAAGSYALTARATDNNSGVTTSTVVNITVTAPPTVSLTAPANNAVFLPGASITVSANAADSGGSVSKVEFFDGAALIGTDTTSPYSIAWTGAGVGTHTITAKATDNLGVATTSAAVTIRVDAPPGVSITAPANNAVFVAPANITLTAAASDTDGTVSKVEFLDGAAIVGTVTAAPYTITLANVALGSHSYTARATDNNNAVTTSSAVSIVVNTAPTVSISAPANGALFTAPVNITVNATAADSDGTVTKVDFFDGATLVGTSTAAPYSFTITNAASGSHVLTARATDNRGTATTSTAVTVNVDAPPTVNITAPLNNAVIVAPANITITATAADTDGTVTKVDFFDGATLVGTANAAPYSVPLTNVPLGSHSYTARATDNQGIVTASAAVNVIVNAAPTVSITSPSANAVFPAPANITVTATASDSDGTVTKVEFFDGLTLVGTATAAPYSFTITNAAGGSHSLTARATDDRGTVTTSTAVTVNVDAPPTVSITAPSNNALIVAPANITITATAADTDGTVTKVDFFEACVSGPGCVAGQILLATSTTPPYSVPLTNVALGAHSYTAAATDNLGIVTTSAAVNVIVNAAPTVSITSPSANAVFPAPASITVTATASDSDGTVTQVDFYDGATLVGTSTAAPYSFTIANAAGGSHSLTARATDNLGTVTTSATVTVNVDAAPTVSITSPANNAVVAAPANITITATATDTDGTVTKVDFFDGDTLVGTANAAPYSVSLTNVALGAHSYTARATDNLGIVTTSSAINVIVNALPSASISSPASGATFIAPATIPLTATAADTDGTIAKVDFYQGMTLVGTATTAPYSFDWANVAAGSYSITAVATDDRGSTSASAPVSITVNANAVPTVSITSPGSGVTFTAPANITVTADAADSDGSVVSVAFYYGTTLITTRDAAPYTFTWTGVPQGTYTLTAVATDDRGATITSAPVSITVNQAAPVAQGYYIHVDHLNTPRLVADASGTTVWKWDQQEPFGVNVPDENPSGLGAFEFPMRFPGQYFDKEDNLAYNYYRNYDSGIGRYVQSDPIGLSGGMNTYAYVTGSPLVLVDPYGLHGNCRDLLISSLETFDYRITSTKGSCPLSFMIQMFFDPFKHLPGQRIVQNCTSGDCVNKKNISEDTMEKEKVEITVCWNTSGEIGINVPCTSKQKKCQATVEVTAKGKVSGWKGECVCN